MAQASALLTYDAVGNREDLSDIITNISPEETPMYSTFGKVKASNVYHEWLQDSLANAADNANIEGADYSFSKPASRTRVGNYTQIFVTPVEVSDTQRAVDTAGVEDEFAYQMAKKLKEHARDKLKMSLNLAISGKAYSLFLRYGDPEERICAITIN